MANRTKFTTKKREDFLILLRSGMSIGKAANAVSISRRTAYDHRKADIDFAAEWDEAVEEGTDLIEDEAWRRAVDGVEDPVYYKGKRVDILRKYSDTLLIVLLKARRPEKYREVVQHSGPDGGAIPVTLVEVIKTKTDD